MKGILFSCQNWERCGEPPDTLRSGFSQEPFLSSPLSLRCFAENCVIAKREVKTFCLEGAETKCCG